MELIEETTKQLVQAQHKQVFFKPFNMSRGAYGYTHVYIPYELHCITYGGVDVALAYTQRAIISFLDPYVQFLLIGDCIGDIHTYKGFKIPLEFSW